MKFDKENDNTLKFLQRKMKGKNEKKEQGKRKRERPKRSHL